MYTKMDVKTKDFIWYIISSCLPESVCSHRANTLRIMLNNNKDLETFRISAEKFLSLSRNNSSDYTVFVKKSIEFFEKGIEILNSNGNQCDVVFGINKNV